MQLVFLSALLCISIGSTTLATVGQKTAQLDYNNIKVALDGKAVNLVDANGNAVEPFAISGTTYLPVRAVADALGLTVGWDSATSTVTLSAPECAQKPAQTSVPTTATTQAKTVYITKIGKRHHYSDTCNGGTYYASTLDEALKRGLTPCDKCVY